MTLLRWLISYSDPWLWLTQSCSFGFIYSVASIFYTVAFPPLGSSNHFIVSVFIDSTSIWKGNALFIVQFMTILVLIGTVVVIIWEMFSGRISFSLTLLLLVLSFVSGSSLELMCISSHPKYQVQLHWSSWFSATCAAAIARGSHFFVW